MYNYMLSKKVGRLLEIMGAREAGAFQTGPRCQSLKISHQQRLHPTDITTLLHMPTNRSFFSQFVGSLIGFRPRSPSSGTPIKASAFTASTSRRRSTSSLNSAGSGGASAGAIKDHDPSAMGAKWWIGGRLADGSERYYPLVPLR
jgi:hypothetical protein